MAPEYGATCGFFPVSRATIDYLTATGRDPQRVALVEAYAKAQGLWHEEGGAEPVFTDTLELDLGTVLPSLAGPKRPQDRVLLSEAAVKFGEALTGEFGKHRRARPRVAVSRRKLRRRRRRRGDRRDHLLHQHLQPLAC